jgi:hypothetical protein
MTLEPFDFSSLDEAILGKRDGVFASFLVTLPRQLDDFLRTEMLL